MRRTRLASGIRGSLAVQAERPRHNASAERLSRLRLKLDPRADRLSIAPERAQRRVQDLAVLEPGEHPLVHARSLGDVGQAQATPFALALELGDRHEQVEDV